MKILIVEDELRVAKLLQRALRDDGHEVDAAYTGETGEKLALSAEYDLIVLDRLLPSRDGLVICRLVREREIDVRILVLTARDSLDDRIDGLNAGADDYLVKPFAIGELLARVRALLRRGSKLSELSLTAGVATLDILSRRLACDDVQIDLTNREFRLLELLMRNKGRTLSRSYIADKIWTGDQETNTNVVDVYINMLRNKAECLRGLIQTVRGEGYRLGAPE